LKADVMSVAKIRLGDFNQDKQEELGEDSAGLSGQMTAEMAPRSLQKHETLAFFGYKRDHHRCKAEPTHYIVAEVFGLVGPDLSTPPRLDGHRFAR